MTVALIPLAFATLTSWLLAGPFGRFLENALPAAEHVPETTSAVLAEVVSTPWTYAVLAVIALGIAAGFARQRLLAPARLLGGVGRGAANSFGFEAINRGIVQATHGTAEALRGTQTGLLNWNVFGIVAGLAAVLIILAMRGA